MLGLYDAAHGEVTPDAPRQVIHQLACSLVGQTQAVKVVPGTLAYRAYGVEETTEQFRCSYGLNPAYRDKIDDGVLQVAGVDPTGEVRIVQLSSHRFFMATLFLPQLSSSQDVPHPVIVAYLKAALVFQKAVRNQRAGPLA